jgi:hypothetical protein
MKAKLLLLIVLALTSIASAQTVDKQKVSEFATAVARAEGFGVKNAIPTRYHNPGNIRSTRTGHHYAGQVGLNRSGYVIFKSDRYGWKALQDQLVLMASGQSAHYGTDMTITKVAKIYATGWRTWSKNVAKVLGVPPTTTLADFFAETEPEAPVVPMSDSLVTFNLPAPTLVVPVLAAN